MKKKEWRRKCKSLHVGDGVGLGEKVEGGVPRSFLVYKY